MHVLYGHSHDHFSLPDLVVLGESRGWRAWQQAAVNSTLALATAERKGGYKRGTKARRRGWGIIRDAAPAQARPGRIINTKPEAMLRVGGQQNVRLAWCSGCRQPDRDTCGQRP